MILYMLKQLNNTIFDTITEEVELIIHLNKCN